jgi:hypothetical protein
MKALIQQRLRAIKLRKEGKSYTQIKEEVKVSKSSLSLWLRRYPLSQVRIRELRNFNEQKIERFRNTMRTKKETRLKTVYQKEQSYLLPLTKKELYIAGLLLYWGEGAKTTPFAASLSNTNPEVVKFFIFWLASVLHVPEKKIIVRLHIYADMDKKDEINFWSKQLGLPLNQFKPPYVKKTTLRGLTYKGFGHGTCNLIVYGREYIEKIMMGIKVISDEYTKKNSK